MKKLLDMVKNVWSRLTNGERVLYVFVCIACFIFGYLFFRMLFTFLISLFPV